MKKKMELKKSNKKIKSINNKEKFDNTIVGIVNRIKLVRDDFWIANKKKPDERPEPKKKALFKISSIFPYYKSEIKSQKLYKEGNIMVAETVKRVEIKIPKKNIYRVSEQIGVVSSDEDKIFAHSHHDLLATSDTRATKRCIEECVGRAFIDEQVQILFPEYFLKNGDIKVINNNTKLTIVDGEVL